MKVRDELATGDEVLEIGHVDLPTGMIVACDPFFCADAVPFTRTVPPGSYPVQLRVLLLEGWGPRIALARVLLKPDPETVSLERAVKPFPLLNSFFVDSGLASFMDEASRDAFATVLVEFYESHPGGNYFKDVLLSELRDQAASVGFPGSSGRCCIHTLPQSDLKIAIFSSGLGDGTYDAFWGLDARGHATSLFIDFKVE